MTKRERHHGLMWQQVKNKYYFIRIASREKEVITKSQGEALYELRQENERLRQENEQLRARLNASIKDDPDSAADR